MKFRLTQLGEERLASTILKNLTTSSMLKASSEGSIVSTIVFCLAATNLQRSRHNPRVIVASEQFLNRPAPLPKNSETIFNIHSFKGCELIEAGFEYVTGEYNDGGKIFRKRK